MIQDRILLAQEVGHEESYTNQSVYVLNEASTQTNHMKSNPNDLIGQQFGDLFVEGYSHRYCGHIFYTCVCACGTRKTVARPSLLSGRTQSCGCLQRKHSRETVLAKTGTKDGTNLSKIRSAKPRKGSKSGIRGVSWNKATNKWMANISYKGKSYYLGSYSTTAEAEAAYLEAKTKILDDILPYEENKPTISETVFFRLSPADRALLEEKANAAGITASEYARNLVIEGINPTPRHKRPRKRPREICAVCGEEFYRPESSKRMTCSMQCKRQYDLMNKIIDPDKNVPVNPKNGPFETHHSAKSWVLQSPDGKEHHIRNLELFMREHAQEYGLKPSQLKSGLTELRRSISGKRAHNPIYEWRGWKLISWGD